MNAVTSNFFASVQGFLDQMGQSVILTADERDIVDDYAVQEFGAEACASYITHLRA